MSAGNAISAGNWIVVPARNNLYLLRAAVRTLRAQDIGNIHLLVVNNGSTDNTADWLRTQPDITVMQFAPQRGVAHAWNQALRYIFSLGGSRRTGKVLVCNQDVELRPDTYRLLAADSVQNSGLFVTGVGRNDVHCLTEPVSLCGVDPPDADGRRMVVVDPELRRPHPDFSCFLITRECYERVGPFDENYAGAFCEDADYHCRMHEAGIQAYCIGLPFYHVGGGSQTVKLADEEEQARIIQQAERNRAYFHAQWGFAVGSREYYEFFRSSAPSGQPTQFRG